MTCLISCPRGKGKENKKILCTEEKSPWPGWLDSTFFKPWLDPKMIRSMPADKRPQGFGVKFYTGLLIFRTVAEPRISSKSAKSREIHKNTQNPAKFARNLTKYMSAHIFESYLGCWGCLLALNLLIYHETSSPQHPKLPGVLRLMLRKTGKQWCKTPGVPSIHRGNWGWGFHRVLTLREEATVCEGLCLLRSHHLQRWRSFSERFSPRMIIKWAKFILVLTR